MHTIDEEFQLGFHIDCFFQIQHRLTSFTCDFAKGNPSKSSSSRKSSTFGLLLISSTTDIPNNKRKLSVRNCFIRGSVVRYVQLPPGRVDIDLLHDATRRESRAVYQMECGQ